MSNNVLIYPSSIKTRAYLPYSSFIFSLNSENTIDYMDMPKMLIVFYIKAKSVFPTQCQIVLF